MHPKAGSTREPVERLAEDFTQRYRNGEQPSLSDYAQRYPEHAETIRELFPALVALEQLRLSMAGKKRDSDSASDPEQPLLCRLGDYHIVREIGRGGMGVVYEAEQLSLGRPVALKVLPPQALLSPTYLERFKREARAAARLRHNNIVQVHGVGESDGLHYYAMQIIHGEGLDKVLGDIRRLRQGPGGRASPTLPTLTDASASVAHSLLSGRFEMPPPGAADTTAGPPSGLSAPGSEAEYYRNVARIGAQVADALAYAHREGVYHRDIKPSNLLLDAQGTVWVTDFGLAKAEGVEDLTQAGDIVGTVRYMAPERFDGHSLPESDVYGLGLTLYEMLTLRPAFDDANKARLIERVLREPPVPPRKLDPHVPRDLETIVLKAIDKDPQRRYPSAAHMAEDLRRLLEGRPILARRASPAERFWLLCRRNPMTASLAAVAVVLLAVLAVGLPLALLLHAQRNDARANLQRAEHAEEELRQSEKEIKIRSHLAHARAHRHSGRTGQRFRCLDEIARAAALNPSEELRRQLRDEAIAALALADLRPVRSWEAPQPQVYPSFDPSFERYPCVGYQGDICICRTTDHEVVQRVPGPGYMVTEVRFAPDGRHLAVMHGPPLARQTQLWDLTRPGKPLLLSGKLSAFTADSQTALAYRFAEGDVGLYDLGSGKELRRLTLGPGWHGFAFRPDGRQLAVTGKGAFNIWDVKRGQVALTIPELAEHGGAVAWSPQGRWLAVAGSWGGEKSIRVWDLEASRLQVSIPALTQSVSEIGFSHAGDVLWSWGWDETLRLWNPTTGQQLVAVGGAGGEHMGFSADDRLLAYTKTDTKITLWEAARPAVEVHALGPRSRGMVLSADFHPDDRLVALGAVDGIHVWDRVARREVAAMPLGESNALWQPRDGSLWTCGLRGAHNLLHWPAAVEKPEGNSTRVRLGPPRPVGGKGEYPALSLSADGKLLGAVRLHSGGLVFDLHKRDRVVGTGLHPKAHFGALSPDGRWLAIGPRTSVGAGATCIWDARTGALVRELPHDLVAGDAKVAFSPDGRWLVTATASTFRFWKPGSWEPRHAVERDQGGTIPGAMAFSRDSKLLAVARTGTLVQLLDPESGEELATLEAPDGNRVYSLAFSRDGTCLAVGRDNHVLHLWDLRRIRSELAALGLDWDTPAYPEPAVKAQGPLEVRMDRQ